MSASPAVHVQDLTFRYGERVALDSISISIERCRIFGFLGPNGGGKTTLFSILSTLLPVQAGVASILGHNVQADSLACRRRIGVTFQAPSLDRRLTVGENLRHQGHLYGLRGRNLTSRMAELLERFSVADRRDEIVGTLSGGLKRRVELAKCLLHRPELLLLDEPSTGLDPAARHDLWQLLEELRSHDGVSIVLTTHLMEEAERCDRLALLDQGRIVAHGGPLELRGTVPGDLITVTTGEPDALRERLAHDLHVTAERAGETLRIRHPDGQALFSELMSRFGNQIQSISLGRPTLEDVFMTHTGRRFSEEAA